MTRFRLDQHRRWYSDPEPVRPVAMICCSRVFASRRWRASPVDEVIRNLPGLFRGGFSNSGEELAMRLIV